MTDTVNPVDPMLMRRTMGRFATGVAVVTTSYNGDEQGMTVNSLTSVSLDPPMLLVCFTKGARTAECVEASGRLAVNMLGARQEEVANAFARRGEDRFGQLNLPRHPSGMPLIPATLAHVVCRVDRIVDGGDHVIVLGIVEDLTQRDGAPLLFYGGSYGDFVDRGHTADFWYH